MTDPTPTRILPWPRGPVNRLTGLDQKPGPDGVRWGLVNRVRAEIAAGLYDTPERLAAAEDELFRRLGS
jgi:hypothetical protein